MVKKRRFGLLFTIVLLVLAVGFAVWFLRTIFEGEKPAVKTSALPEFISGEQQIAVQIADRGRGLRLVKATLNQGGREIEVFREKFAFKGFLNSSGTHQYRGSFPINPAELNLAQGRADLRISVWDYSRRRGGDGNLAVLQHKMVVDTIPPSIRPITRLHYVKVGGAGLVLYQTSSDAVESGVYVDKDFFSGFPAEKKADKGYRVCYFAVPYDAGTDYDVYLWTKDRAGNETKTHFNHKILGKRFRRERINISDRFLEKILPYFKSQIGDAGPRKIDQFLEINRATRKANGRTFQELGSKTAPERLWEGSWLRMRNAATMARFGDHRSYYYQGEKIDQQVHLGTDLASLANSDVQAANSGQATFAGMLGIYGLTVVLDHGQGVASAYSHLSKIAVEVGQRVKKGDVIGISGQTGLAGGDHLHFSVLVGGIPVNPIEWWDAHWLQDNVERKLALLEE
jgi:murein DD-endopeptidase MepM/ murein hydrolase activator NlpD